MLAIGGLSGLAGGALAARFLLQGHATWSACLALTIASLVARQNVGPATNGEPSTLVNRAWLAASFAAAGAALVVGLPLHNIAGHAWASGAMTGLGLSMLPSLLASGASVQVAGAPAIDRLRAIGDGATRVEAILRWPMMALSLGSCLLPGGALLGVPALAIAMVHHTSTTLSQVSSLVGQAESPTTHVLRLQKSMVWGAALGAIVGGHLLSPGRLFRA